MTTSRAKYATITANCGDKYKTAAKTTLNAPNFRRYGLIGRQAKPCGNVKPNFGTFNTSGKYWDYGTLEANKSSIAKKAENYIIVDGEAYERTGEPYYSVTCFGLGNNHGGTGFFVGWADYRDRKAIWGMTAADKHAAIEKGVQIALERGDTESEEHIRQTPYDIQVFIPECIKRKYSKEY